MTSDQSPMPRQRDAQTDPVVEAKAQKIARGIPIYPLSDGEKARIIEAMKTVPLPVRQRVRQLVSDRWDLVSAARNAKELAKADIDRVLRNSRAAIAFVDRLLGKES